MPTNFNLEIEARNAIADAIKGVLPNANVVPRNILNVRDDGSAFLLLDEDDDKVNGWMVTQAALNEVEQRTDAVEYQIVYSVWQFYQYNTGNNTTNSEDSASVDRAKVLDALAKRTELPVSLASSKPLTFGVIDIFPANVAGGQLHIAQGSMTVPWLINCG